MNITPTLWTATESFRTAARFEDVNAVERLVRSTGAFSEAEVAIARELVEESLSRGEEISGYRFLFAEGSSGLNGYTCLGPIAGTVNRYELYWIVVHPNIRRAKLGHRLLQASEEMVRTLGGVRLFVESSTRGEYAAARRFYAAEGYSLLAEVPDWHADGDGMVIFGKRL